MNEQAEGAYALVLHEGADPETGGVAICGFSTVGMVGVIAASHIISSLGLDHLGTVLNKHFPAIALVHDEVPKHPVRVYQGKGVGVFTSEIQFPAEHDVEFANTVLEWYTRGGFERLIIVDGLVRQEKTTGNGGLYGIGSIKQSRQRLADHEIEKIQQGVIAGIAGHLLSEGDRRGLDITALLAECNPMYPDARAAALAVEAIADLTGMEIPLSGLIEDARKIEDSVKEVFEKAQTMLPAPVDKDDEHDPMIG
ncbi:MAG: proteasome assembly chaperone family protein [Euryarchaeota archaeon]|jgi:uncharacterized protein|nr:proteasome assembly chaperone family protein [Euryarchaeota archaeon]MBT7937884.1 proteasome assembly chaperone family protein [Euryarchaeota archaeon]